MSIPDGAIEVNQITDYWSFLMSIEWKDPWLIALITIHILTTTTTLMTRNYTNFQLFLFLVLLLAAYFSESINEYAATNWHSFSQQQYFDCNGIFMSTVFSIPILLNCMFLIGAWLYSSTQLMTRIKIAQLRERAQIDAARTRSSISCSRAQGQYQDGHSSNDNNQ